MIPPPPTSTLFPYTTLFRSRRDIEENDGRGGRSRRRLEAREGEDARHITHRRGDRKSTRLNSSHVAISYAVFCLKKKTKQKRKSEITATCFPKKTRLKAADT